MSQPKVLTANGSSGGGASSPEKRKFLASPDPCSMSQEMSQEQEKKQPVQPPVQPSGLDRKIAAQISDNNLDIGSLIPGGPNRVISPEELERREKFCARQRDRTMHSEELNIFFGLSKERKPTGRFITEKNTLAPNVMKPNQGRIVPTNKEHGGHGFNVRPRPDFTRSTFETKKTVDEIFDAVELISLHMGFLYMDGSEFEEKNKNNDLPASYSVYLPHHGKWEIWTPQCGFQIRIFLAPNGQEGEPDEFTVEVSRIWGCRFSVNYIFDLLKGEVSEGHLTEQLRLAALYEEEQRLIVEGVDGAEATVIRHYSIHSSLTDLSPKFIYNKMEEKSVCEDNV